LVAASRISARRFLPKLTLKEISNMDRHRRRIDARVYQTDPRALEILQRGVQCHQTGLLAQAEDCYRQVLAVQPNHADALHLLGLLAHQGGRLDAAIELIRLALQQYDQNPVFCANLAVVLRDGGKVDEAVAEARKAVELQPEFADAYCVLGAALRDQGKLGESIAASRLAIRHNPQCADAYSNLGAALRDQGKLDEAISAFRQANQIAAHVPMFHFNLGAVLHERGHLDDAIAAYLKATQLKPDWAEVYSNLGAALREQGKLDEAVAACLDAIRLKQNLAAAHSNLGAALRDKGWLEDAIVSCREAIRLDPNIAEAHSTLGVALREQDKLDEAIAVQREAIRINPDFANAHCNLGGTLSEQGKLEEAAAAYRQAISLKPGYDVAHANLGQALAHLGRFSESRGAFEEAIRLAPAKVMYRRQLGELARLTPADPHLRHLESLLQSGARLSIENQIEAHFALGKAYEDIGRHELAFRHLLDGNALKRRQLSYDENAVLGMFDRIRSVFTSRLVEKLGHAGHPSAVPVFVIGMPRSGTTLIEQILASHPLVFGAGELKHFEKAVKSVLAAAGSMTEYPEAVAVMKKRNFSALGATYVAQIGLLAPSAARIVNKMPHNYLFAGLIHLALPNAAIIHAVRDPADTCVSCFSRLFADRMNYAYDLAELGRYYRGYRAVMSHWQRVLPPGRILEVKYEDVVAGLERQARRIVAHCGLEWDARCLTFHQSPRPVRTASAAQVRQPIYGDSVGRWRRYESFLGPLLSQLQ
jgi:tetratricopeptide (TPR) repeat protein